MGVWDDIKKEHKKVRNGTPQEKVKYIADYYIWQIFLFVILIIILLSIVFAALTRKETVLSGVMLNSNELISAKTVESLCEEFLVDQGLDTSKNEVSINSNLTLVDNDDSNATNNYIAVQTIMAQIEGKILDFVVSDLDSAINLAYSEFFVDLSTVLTPEQLAYYEPYLLYIDRAVIVKLQEAVSSENYEIEIEIPDCTQPELMEEPVPVFIDLSGNEKLEAFYPDAKNEIVLAVAVNAPDIDRIIEWVDYLLAQP